MTHIKLDASLYVPCDLRAKVRSWMFANYEDYIDLDEKLNPTVLSEDAALEFIDGYQDGDTIPEWVFDLAVGLSLDVGV